jgi:hypothetical protein
VAGAFLGAFAVWAIAFRRRVLRLLAVLLTVLVAWGCWAELYRGEHFLSDVSGGMLLGCAIALSLCLGIALLSTRTRV